MKDVVKILSIDGGGVRGLIPALILQEIKKRLSENGDARGLAQVFDIMAGTSTGGIIALGLSMPQYDGVQPMGVDELVDLYENKTDNIFPQGKFPFAKTIRQVFRAKYSVKPLEKILLNYMGNTTLENAQTNLLIPAYNTEKRNVIFFKKRPLEKFSKDTNFYMRDVARATSAAPTYYKPAHISPVNGGEKLSLIDGGVFVNNPALAAYIEARKIYPKAKSYIVVSLGTGSTDDTYEYKRVRKWGFGGWISPSNGVPLLSIMMDGQSDSVNHQLKLLPKVDYYRFNMNLINCSDELDNASKKNITSLRKIAEKIIEDNNDKIDELINKFRLA